MKSVDQEAIYGQLSNFQIKYMDSNRLTKVSRLVQKELGDYFQKQARSYGANVMITVTQAKVTSDLSEAKVYLSIFPSNKGAEVLEAVKANKWKIRHELAQRTADQLRRVPELSYFVDDSLDKMERIDQILKEDKMKSEGKVNDEV